MKNEIDNLGQEEIPRFMDIVARYKNHEDLKHIKDAQTQKEPTKFLSNTNRSLALQASKTAHDQYRRAWKKRDESNDQTNSIFDYSRKLDKNRTLMIDSTLEEWGQESIHFQIQDPNDQIASLTFTRNNIPHGTTWELFDRQMSDEYKGGGDNELGASSIIIDCAHAFFQQNSNVMDKVIHINLPFSQPQVGIWSLKNGYAPASQEDGTKWKKMCHPYDNIRGEPPLDMRGDFMVFPQSAEGWERRDYAQSYLVNFQRTLSPETVSTSISDNRGKSRQVLNAQS